MNQQRRENEIRARLLAYLAGCINTINPKVVLSWSGGTMSAQSTQIKQRHQHHELNVLAL